MLRRAALYGVPSYGAGWQECYSALLAALEGRFGHKRVWQRTSKTFDVEDVADDVALAVIQGLRGGGADYLREYLRLGIPVLVVDLGWFRRERDYWQVCPGGLNVAPPRAPDGRRFDDLGLKVFPRIARDNHTLLVGQLPGDKQHDLATDADLIDWAKRTAVSLRQLDSRRRIFWRPHPSFVTTLGPPSIMTRPDRPLQSVIKDDYVGSAVVYNSSMGLDLLRLGVSVIAQGPRTVYTELVSSDISLLTQSHPGPERVRELLERVAYGQYQTRELTQWSTLETLLELHGIAGDW